MKVVSVKFSAILLVLFHSSLIVWAGRDDDDVLSAPDFPSPEEELGEESVAFRMSMLRQQPQYDSSDPFSISAPKPARTLSASCDMEGGEYVGYCPCSGDYFCYVTRTDGSTSCYMTNNCQVKPGWTAAQACNDLCPDGTMMDDGCCYSDKTLAATFSSMPIERVGNTILIQSEEIFQLLYAGYTDADECSKKYSGVEFATSAVLAKYKDVFDFTYIYPYYNIQDVTGKYGCTSQTSLGGYPMLKREEGGALRSMISSFPIAGGSIASQHELGHHWLVSLDSLPQRKATISGDTRYHGSHWGFTALDKHGMLGGYSNGTFKCLNPANHVPTKLQPCQGNNLAPFSPYQGSTQTSHDSIGEFAKLELMIMGLMSADEIPDEALVHCKNMVTNYNPSTKLYEDVTCEEIIHLTAEEIENSLTSQQQLKQITVGTTLRAAHVIVFDNTYDLPKNEAELQDAKWKGYANWIHGYGPTLENRFFQNTYQKAILSFDVSDSDLGCGLSNKNLCIEKEEIGGCRDSKKKFYHTKKKSKRILKTCAWLRKQSEKVKAGICKNKVDYWKKSEWISYGPAQDVCQGVCASCDKCYENPKSKFYLRTRKKKPVYRNCAYLKKVSKSKKDRLCKKEQTAGGYKKPKDACPIICGAC